MKKSLTKAKRQNNRRHIGAYILIIVALIALCLTTWRYFTPLSGITGAEGALLAMFGTFMLIIAGIILSKFNTGFFRILFLLLSWVGILGTIVALLFLHGYISALCIAIGILALAYESFASTMRSSSR